MKIPEDYLNSYHPDGYHSFTEYLIKYNRGLLFKKPFIPFWVRTLLGSLDLIGPETDTDLQRIIALVLEDPTYEHLHQIRSSILEMISAARGPDFYRVWSSRLDDKYGVICDLFEGLYEEPFNINEWAININSYVMLCFDLDEEKQAVLDERIKEALVKFEPNGGSIIHDELF